MGPALQVEAVQGEVKAVEALVDEWANKSLQTSHNTTQNHLAALKQAKGTHCCLPKRVVSVSSRVFGCSNPPLGFVLPDSTDCMQQLKATEAEMSEKATLLEKRTLSLKAVCI